MASVSLAKCSRSSLLPLYRHAHPALSHLSARSLHVSAPLSEERAGRYKVTINRTKPLTYEMAFKPFDIAVKKAFNAYNTGQLEDTFLMKEEIGQDLPYKLLSEDMFVRRFMHGTWPEVFESELVIKRQHNIVRIAGIINRSRMRPEKIYFLIGYTEEILSYWLKAPVKLELQSVENPDDLIFKYI